MVASMHWSKTRHLDYVRCPRRFFYSNVAAPQNAAIRDLAERRTPALIRHELVREAIRTVLDSDDHQRERLPQLLAMVRERFHVMVGETIAVNEQMSIIALCLENFFDCHVSRFPKNQIIHTTTGGPVEFVYDRLSIMAVPEVVVDEQDHIRIVSWRTGSSQFRAKDDIRLRAAGLTCWSRSVLGCVDRPTVITDIYLREQDGVFDKVLSDADIRSFVDESRAISAQYAASAKVRDFPALPSHSNCRFCSFATICPEQQEFAETSYDIDTLSAEIAADLKNTAQKRVRDRALDEVAGEVRSVFLSHCSDDKEKYVRPFARALEAKGISYWLDEAELRWGDSLTQGVNRGLSISEYVICFISDAFVERGWPEAELGAALSGQLSGDGTTVLPILIAEPDRVFREYPLLRDRRAQRWEDGIDVLVGELARLIP